MLTAIAEDLFPNVINNLRVAGPTTAREPSIGESLQEVLAELFPNADIKVRPLQNSVVLSGTVERAAVEPIVRIAEDYYPQVIVHLHNRPTKTAPAGELLSEATVSPSGPASSLKNEIRQIRDDVRSLRRDVGRLIEILEQSDNKSEDKGTPDLDDEKSSALPSPAKPDVWELLGIRAEPTKVEKARYRGGMKIIEVREGSPAAEQRIREGDVLVGIDRWETVDQHNLSYALAHAAWHQNGGLKFYILRGGETLFGQMKLPPKPLPPSKSDASDIEPRTMWDLSLEQANSIALQNSGIVRLGFDPDSKIRLSRVDSDLTLSDFEISVRNVIAEVEDAYWKLWAAHRDVESNKLAKSASQVAWNNVYEKKAAGLENAQQEQQAREHYFNRRELVKKSLAALDSREAELRKTLRIAATDGRLIRPSDEPDAAEVKLDEEEASAASLANRPELRRQTHSVEQAELALQATRSGTSPQIELRQHYRWLGIGNDLGNDFGSDSDLKKLGVQLNLPVGLRRSLATVRHAELRLARAKAVQQELETQLSASSTQAVKKLRTARELLVTTFDRFKATRSESESATALHKGGKTTLDHVLAAQRRFAEAGSEYHKAAAEYAIAVKNVRFQQGLLLEERNLAIAEAETSTEIVPLTSAEAEESTHVFHVKAEVFARLLKGDAYAKSVKEEEQGLRRFRVVLDRDHEYAPADKPPVQGEIAVGWRPNEAGGLEYLLQLTPAQHKQVVEGATIDCTVHPDVKSIGRILIFVGEAELPRKLHE